MKKTYQFIGFPRGAIRSHEPLRDSCETNVANERVPREGKKVEAGPSRFNVVTKPKRTRSELDRERERNTDVIISSKRHEKVYIREDPVTTRDSDS